MIKKKCFDSDDYKEKVYIILMVDHRGRKSDFLKKIIKCIIFRRSFFKQVKNKWTLIEIKQKQKVTIKMTYILRTNCKIESCKKGDGRPMKQRL